MVDISRLSFGKTVFFLIFLIVLFILYYKKLLNVDGNENKKIKMVKQVFAFIVIVGLLHSFTSVKDPSFKLLLLVIIVVIVNIYNISHSIKKCNYDNLYKLNIYIRAVIIIIFLSLLLRYTDNYGLLSFLYGEKSDSDKILGTTLGQIKTDIDLKLRDSIPEYCPDMNNTKYEDDDKWKKLNDKQKNNCIAGKSGSYERSDIASKVYA